MLDLLLLQLDAAQQVAQAIERTLLPSGHDRGDGTAPQVAHLPEAHVEARVLAVLLHVQRERFSAVIDVRRPDRNAQPHGLGHVDRRVMEAAVVRQPRAEELGGPVRLEVGGAVAHVGVGGRVALVETVAGERHDLLPERVGLVPREARPVGRRPRAARTRTARGIAVIWSAPKWLIPRRSWSACAQLSPAISTAIRRICSWKISTPLVGPRMGLSAGCR